MDVEYAFLADGAQTAADGKLYVLGGGIDRITSEAFPARHPILALVVKLKLHSSECDREHNIEIELWDRDGRRLGPKVDAQFRVERQPNARPGFIQMVLNFFGAEFPKPDEYEFHIVVDGEHRKSLPLYVERLDAAEGERGGAPRTGGRGPNASES